jgi:hypothetical protein
MASDWIKEKADHEAKAAATSARQQEIRLRKNELIKALGPTFLKNLINSLNEDITDWNSRFKDRQINGVSEIQDGYHVEKLTFPRGSAFVRFNPETLRIEIQMQRSRPMDNSMYEHSGFFCLEANPDDKDIHMEDHSRRAHVTASGFTKIIIESIADPMSHSSF